MTRIAIEKVQTLLIVKIDHEQKRGVNHSRNFSCYIFLENYSKLHNISLEELQIILYQKWIDNWKRTLEFNDWTLWQLYLQQQITFSTKLICYLKKLLSILLTLLKRITYYALLFLEQKNSLAVNDTN